MIEAYLGGLEALAARDPQADLGDVASVASFFVSRVDTAVDRRLAQIATPESLALRGQAGIAQAKLAYQLFRRRFAGPRWEALAARGARVQRLLWASTGTKNPADSDTRYIDELIGPDTVTTIPTATITALQPRHGRPHPRPRPRRRPARDRPARATRHRPRRGGQQPGNRRRHFVCRLLRRADRGVGRQGADAGEPQWLMSTDTNGPPSEAGSAPL